MPGTTTTRRAARRVLFDLITNLGFPGTADTVAAGSITDAYAFQDSALGVNHFRGTYIYRPTTTGDDVVKKAGNLTLATGLLAHTGSNYTDITETLYEIIGPLHPDELNACIQRALRKVYFETQTVLTLGSDLATITDFDMEANNTTSWTATSSTLTKSTGVANVFSGLRSLRVANSGANGRAESVSYPVHRGEPVYIAAIARADVGTANFQLYDITNSVALQTFSSTQEGWVHFWWQGNVGSTTEEVAFRLIGTESTADVYWDSIVFYRLADRRIVAPSWLDEPWKFLKLRQAVYKRNLAANVDDANSRTFADWFTPQHFTLDPFHPEANAYAVQLRKPLPSADLWLEGKRPFFDLEPLTNDTDTTTAPLQQLLAYTKLELAQLLVKRYPTDPSWRELLLEATKEIEAETLARPEVPQEPIRKNLLGRI